MTILFRYILREFSKIFGMCFAGLVTIYLVIDFFEKVRRFLRYESGLLPILTYFALKIPSISFQVAPFAILVATLLTRDNLVFGDWTTNAPMNVVIDDGGLSSYTNNVGTAMDKLFLKLLVE